MEVMDQLGAIDLYSPAVAWDPADTLWIWMGSGWNKLHNLQDQTLHVVRLRSGEENGVVPGWKQRKGEIHVISRAACRELELTVGAGLILS